MNTRLNTLLLGTIFVLAAIVRVGVAMRSPLWVDEIFSLAIATGHSLEHPAPVADPALGDFAERDRPETASALRRYLGHDDPPATPARVLRAVMLSDTSPPLYYLLLYGWTLMVGTGDLALRMFSVVWALACLPLLAAIARRVGGSRAVVSTCALFAFSPPAVYYSTEGRMYSLLWFCILATALLSLILRQRGGGRGLFALWIVASAAGFLTHYFFVFPWAAIVAWLVFRPGSFPRSRLAVCIVLVAALVSPWYVKAPENFSNWRVTQGWLEMEPSRFDRLKATTDFTLQYFTGKSVRYWKLHRRSTTAALTLFGVVAVVMLWRMRGRAFDDRRLLLWLWFAAACAGPMLYDLVKDTYAVDMPRYALAALPAAYLLAAVGLACLRFRTRTALLALIVLAWAPSLRSIYRNPARSGPPLWALAYNISKSNGPSDLVLVHSIPSGVLALARYVDGPVALGAWVGQLGQRRVPESLSTLLANRTRVLFVKFHHVGEAAPEEEWLRQHACVASETWIGPAFVADFRPKDAPTF